MRKRRSPPSVYTELLSGWSVRRAMEKTQGAGDAHGSGAGISTQQEQQQQQRTQQLVPESYMVPETAVREGNVSGMRRMQSGGPAQAQVGSMTMQVTQTRRTIFPGATGNSIMRAVGHDIQYQHPGEMLQLHTYCTLSLSFNVVIILFVSSCRFVSLSVALCVTVRRKSLRITKITRVAFFYMYCVI